MSFFPRAYRTSKRSNNIDILTANLDWQAGVFATQPVPDTNIQQNQQKDI